MEMAPSGELKRDRKSPEKIYFLFKKKGRFTQRKLKTI
jgi:hypothetical protein